MLSATFYHVCFVQISNQYQYQIRKGKHQKGKTLQQAKFVRSQNKIMNASKFWLISKSNLLNFERFLLRKPLIGNFSFSQQHLFTSSNLDKTSLFFLSLTESEIKIHEYFSVFSKMESYIEQLISFLNTMEMDLIFVSPSLVVNFPNEPNIFNF